MFGSICFLFNVGVLVYLLFLFTLHYTWFLRFNQDLAVPNVEDRSIATDRCQLPFDLFGGFTMYHMYIYIQDIHMHTQINWIYPSRGITTGSPFYFRKVLRSVSPPADLSCHALPSQHLGENGIYSPSHVKSISGIMVYTCMSCGISSLYITMVYKKME